MNKSISLIRLAVGVLLLLLVVTFTSCIFFAASDTGIAVPNLTVKGAPSDITALSLRITGPGMAPLESYYSSVPSSITIEVPAGNDREFELLAYPSSSSAAVSFIGTATVDLTAGKTTEVVLTMGLNETKLVIPDNNNNRIVQIDDMSGGGWLEIINGNLGYPLSLAANDIDFDSQGRIYIAIDTASSTDHFIIRIDNLDAVTYTPIIMGKGSPCVALTADRKNSYLYYATSIALYRCDLDGANDTTLTTAGLFNIRGLAVDENGLLYIAYANSIAAYNPISQATLDAELIDTSSYDIAWDAMVKSSFIYCAVYETTALSGNLRIIQFIFEAGSLVEQDSYNITLYGPHRFIGTINSRIYFIDENTVPQDRLVCLDDINDNTPEYYGSTGVGIGQFDFYE